MLNYFYVGEKTSTFPICMWASPSKMNSIAASHWRQWYNVAWSATVCPCDVTLPVGEPLQRADVELSVRGIKNTWRCREDFLRTGGRRTHLKHSHPSQERAWEHICTGALTQLKESQIFMFAKWLRVPTVAQLDSTAQHLYFSGKNSQKT